MPAELDDAALAEERKWKIERSRQRFRFALALVVLLVLMYFVVAPISAAYGQPLQLPPLELVTIFLAIFSAPAFGVSVSPGEIIKSALARVNVTIGAGKAQEREHGDTE